MPAPRRVSHNQMQELLNFMEANTIIAKGRVVSEGGPSAKQRMKSDWEDLARALNCHRVGATKSAKEWKIYWNNLKYKTRVKFTERRKRMWGTNGDLAWEKGDLSDDDWRILNITGKSTVLGNETVAIPFDVQEDEPSPDHEPDEPSPSTSAQKLNRKRKYTPETEIDEDEIKCEDDEETPKHIFENYFQSYSDDGSVKPEKMLEDSATSTDIIDTKNDSLPSVVDLHGCKYFGQLISNELLRFDADRRYTVMQKILEVLLKSDKK